MPSVAKALILGADMGRGKGDSVFRPRFWLGVALSAVLAGCASAPQDGLASRSEPGLAQPQAAFAAAPRFGDADAFDWGGPGPAAYAVHGIDVSRFQGDIDWRAVRRAGVAFAYVKATEGGDHLDPRFRDNWRAARRASPGVSPS